MTPDWLTTLLGDLAARSRAHGVEPMLFVALYFGSIPPYLACLAWLVRRLRRKQAAHLPLFATIFFFFMPSLYVAAFGRDLPLWVYGVIAVLVVLGIGSLRRTLRRRLASAEG